MKNFSTSEENYLKCIFALSAKHSPPASAKQAHNEFPGENTQRKRSLHASETKSKKIVQGNYQNPYSDETKHIVTLTYSTVSTSALAEKMKLRSASITNMLKKLNKNGLIEYTPYQGVRLSSSGQKVALHTLRKHRLWETFLHDKLHFNWQEVHEIAEQLEHIKSRTLIDRLEELLGFPHFDPHGDPIPDIDGRIHLRTNIVTLAELNKGERGVIKRILENASELLSHLDEIGLNINTNIEMVSINAFDNSHKIKLHSPSLNVPSQKIKRNKNDEIKNEIEGKELAVGDKKTIFVSHKIAKLILLQRCN